MQPANYSCVFFVTAGTVLIVIKIGTLFQTIEKNKEKGAVAK